MGAGNSIGGMDAANILKPALARGTIQIIGATTIDEYRKSIEKDAALDRRLQPLIIKESTERETVKILAGIKKHYEKYHQVTFSNRAILQAANLAKKYITNRFLPDSAIDLLDETAARKRSYTVNTPLLKKYNLSKKKLTALINLKEALIMENNYEEALLLKQQEHSLVKTVNTLKKQLEAIEKKEIVTIDSEDILETLSSITNISPELLNKHNSDLSAKITHVLKEKLVGQKHIQKNINSVIIRRLGGLSRQQGPLGSFIFIGPTGVGKTMTAKLLAQAISPNEKASLIQINMSEFTEKHTLSRLLGAPAGYVGHEENGELSNKIQRNPFSVVLFDEIEKADPSILNILLQILEEGKMVDAKNKNIDFRNTLIILTSNIGTEELDNFSQLGFSTENNKDTLSKKQIQEIIKNELQTQLAPELLARIDNTLIFNNLQKKDIAKIVRLSLNSLQRKLKKRQVNLTFDKAIIPFLVEKSVALDQGARLVRKNIQDFVEPVVAKELLRKKPRQDIKLLLGQTGQQIIIKK